MDKTRQSYERGCLLIHRQVESIAAHLDMEPANFKSGHFYLIINNDNATKGNPVWSITLGAARSLILQSKQEESTTRQTMRSKLASPMVSTVQMSVLRRRCDGCVWLLVKYSVNNVTALYSAPT